MTTHLHDQHCESVLTAGGNHTWCACVERGVFMRRIARGCSTPAPVPETVDLFEPAL